MNSNLYNDIAKRTGGDIYIGVVGPVRTGKSTFIKRFMDTVVLPNITDEARRERATDELPQSAAGRTIMTTEPKFIPEQAVRISVGDSGEFKVRLIDCVGYIVPSSLGYIENEAPRMVRTPWLPEEIPFNLAAEIGTRKVITEHSTVGLVITADGSFGEIPREEYAEAEQQVIRELSELGKPFAVVLNTKDPTSETARQTQQAMEQRYGISVLTVNCLELTGADILEILRTVLYEFPIREIAVNLPGWILRLPQEHWLRADVVNAVTKTAAGLTHIRDLPAMAALDGNSEFIKKSEISGCDYGSGCAGVEITVQDGLLFRVLSETTGQEIADESELFAFITEAAARSAEYGKYKNAIDEVMATGYGIVMPGMEELALEPPEIMRQNGKYGVRLRASAPSIHLLRADIKTEIRPVVGSESQSEELLLYLLKDYEESPEKIWQSNIFGKTLHELVNEGLHAKLQHMPPQARQKLQDTIQRIINDGCSGLLCIII